MKKIISILVVIASLFTLDMKAYPLYMLYNTENINILSTSDLHGRIDGYDYNTGIVIPIGLDRIANIIKKEKYSDEDAIVLDAGDFNRGNPMVDIYNTLKGDETNPVVDIMNRIGYDAVTPGNHEFDYGISMLNKVKREAGFPIISANVFYNGQLMFKPYTIIKKKGINIGIVGLTTTAAVKYNSGDDIEGLEIKSVSKQAAKYVSILKNEEKVDIVIAVVHSGIEGVYDAPEDETDVLKLTKLHDKPDVIISGHSHMIIPYMDVNDVIIQSPGAMGAGVGKIGLEMQKIDGKWRIVNSKGTFIPSFLSNSNWTIDKDIKTFKSNTVSYINTKIGYLKRPDIYTNNELINIVKLKDTNADIVVDENIKESKLTGKEFEIKDMYNLYERENYIIGITTKGKNIKKYLNNRIASGIKVYNNIYNLRYIRKGNNIEIYIKNKKINDSDDINIALTGRQLNNDTNIKKSGISSGKIYYNSYSKYGLQGRVRQRMIYYIQNSMI